ncbi:MAG: hypothetical protein WB988_04190 [Candidatus Nitrosopolaris sp.]
MKRIRAKVFFSSVLSKRKSHTSRRLIPTDASDASEVCEDYNVLATVATKYEL